MHRILIDDLASLLHVKGRFAQVAERGLERGRERERERRRDITMNTAVMLKIENRSGEPLCSSILFAKVTA